jgi:hypothetical protein
MNECIPKYEPGADLTGQVTEAGGVLGKRVLAISGDKQGVEAVSDDTSGGNILVAYPAAGGRIVGVSGYDAPVDRKVKVVRGPGKVVPIRCSIALAYDVEVEAAADGTVVPLGTAVGGRALGRTFRAAAINTDALVELY